MSRVCVEIGRVRRPLKPSQAAKAIEESKKAAATPNKSDEKRKLAAAQKEVKAAEARAKAAEELAAAAEEQVDCHLRPTSPHPHGPGPC